MTTSNDSAAPVAADLVATFSGARRLLMLGNPAMDSDLAAERFRAVIEAVPNGLVMIDAQGLIVLFNQEAERMFGFSREEVANQKIEMLLPERYAHSHVPSRQMFFHDASPRLMGGGRDLFARRKDGTEFPVEVGLNPIDTPEGTMVLAAIADISERKEAERRLQEYARELERSNQELDIMATASRRNEVRLEQQTQLLQNVHDAVFCITAGGTVVTWNPGAARVYGFEESEIVGTNISRVFPDGEKDRFTARVYPEVLRSGSIEFVARSIRNDSREIYVEVRASAFRDPDDGHQAVLICANDITVQKQLEQRTLEISEREQQRIGQDIHDDLCQQLAGIGCLTKVLEKRSGDLFAGVSDELSQLGKMVSDANVRARAIARGLAPAVVENLGLKSALEELAAQSRLIYKIDCRIVSGSRERDVPQGTAVQLFRIAQEAVNNAVRHGGASHVEFRLDTSAGVIHLEIRDDGSGMKKNASEVGIDGLGLLSMRHRAEVLGGELAIESNNPGGVIVSATVPVQSSS